MDKQSIIAIVVAGLLFFGFTYYSSQERQKYEAQLAQIELQKQQIEDAEAEKRAAIEALAAAQDSTEVSADKNAEAEKAYNVAVMGEALATAKSAQAETITLDNDVMTIDFSTRGGQVAGVTLKDYTKYADSQADRTELVEMFERATSVMELEFYILNGLNNVKVNTSEYTFRALPIQSVEGGERLSMILDLGSNSSVEYIYTLYNSEDDSRNYMLDYEVKFHDLAPIMGNQANVAFNWSQTSYQNERGFKNENQYSTIAYHYKDDNSNEEIGVSEDKKSDSIDDDVQWISFKQQFFNSTIIALDNFSTANVAYSTAKPGSGFMKSYSMKATLPYSAQSEGYNFALYFGPNKYAVLNGLNDLSYGDLNLEDVIPLGWGIFGWINKFFVIKVFDLLRNFIGSFGIIILILTLLIKLIISPMTYSSYTSMAKMRVVKPDVDAITKKYPNKDDAMKRQQATMDLYKKAGINPMGGCIPMLIQMPIIFAMFRFFPASIELRGESFLWSHDLSSYDSVLNLPFNIPFYGDHVSLFALMMAISMFGYTYINMKQNSSSQPEMAGMNFMMLYLMPIMMLVWFNNYSSGLCYYYFLSNLFTIAQTYIIRNMVDDEKILAKIHINSAKKSKGKKSKFQQRYEELVAEQERLMKEKNAKK